MKTMGFKNDRDEFVIFYNAEVFQIILSYMEDLSSKKFSNKMNHIGVAWRTSKSKDIMIDMETIYEKFKSRERAIKVFVHEMLHLFEFKHLINEPNIMFPYNNNSDLFTWDIIDGDFESFQKALRKNKRKQSFQSLQRAFKIAEESNCGEMNKLNVTIPDGYYDWKIKGYPGLE